MSTGCRVCDDKAYRRAVDEEFDKGSTGAFVARLMTARGFTVSADIVNRHRKEDHRKDYEQAPLTRNEANQQRRDAARIIKAKTLDALEAAQPTDFVDNKGVRDVAQLALKAQGMEDKREQKKAQVNFWIELYSGQQAETPVLLEDPTVIEGEAVEVD